jgi:hypothetical protein
MLSDQEDESDEDDVQTTVKLDMVEYNFMKA